MAPLSRQHLSALAVHDVITGERLRAAGVTKDALKHLVATERLFRQYRGVFSLTPSLTDRGRWFAAVAACGERAALSHLSAAILWKLTTIRDHVIHVTVPNGNGRRDPKGLCVHRTTRPQSTRRDRIEVTTLHRTLDDCARGLTHQQLHAYLRNAEYHHRLDINVLATSATSSLLKALLATYVAGQGVDANQLEATFVELCARAGLPAPQRQTWHGPRRVDFTWPDHRLIVELDGRDAHDRSMAFQDDRARDRVHKLQGWDTLRFTWSEVVGQPALVILHLQQFFALRPRVES